MPVIRFTDDRYANSADFGTAYTLTPTEEARVSGQVFLDMSQHQVLANGHRELRPKILIRFFGLRVAERWLGTPTCTVFFQPDWTGTHGGVPAVSLGELGRLIVELDPRLAGEDVEIQDMVIAVAQTVSAAFLTDDQVAGYRYHLANLRRQRTSSAHDLATMRQELAYRRSLAARADADAADALLKAVRDKHSLQLPTHDS